MGNYQWAFDCHHYLWPWMTLNRPSSRSLQLQSNISITVYGMQQHMGRYTFHRTYFLLLLLPFLTGSLQWHHHSTCPQTRNSHVSTDTDTLMDRAVSMVTNTDMDTNTETCPWIPTRTRTQTQRRSTKQDHGHGYGDGHGSTNRDSHRDTDTLFHWRTQILSPMSSWCSKMWK